MNTDALRAEGTCPSVDELSAWHDAAATDARIDAHIRNCTACQSVLHHFEMVDMAIQQHLDEVLPEPRTLEQITTNVNRHIQPQRMPILTFRGLLRVAACLAALLLVVVIMNQLSTIQQQPVADAGDLSLPETELESNPMEDELSPLNRKLIDDLVAEFGPLTSSRPVNASPTGSTPRIETVAARPVSTPPVTTSNPLLPPGGHGIEGPMPNASRLDLSSDIDLVWYGPPPAFQDEYPPSTGDTGVRKTVRDRVRHVWLVNDTSAPLQELQQLLPRHKQDFQELINQQRDEYVLQLVISDHDLQDLVDHFDSLDFKLISPSAPQPGDSANLRLTGKSIQYEVDFVRE